MRFRWLVLLLCSSFSLVACQPASPPQPEFKTDATIKDIMDSIVDPSADFIWESVATTVTAAGTEEKMPRTDEEWLAVRRHTIALVESTNLLLIPGRPVARPHEKSLNPGIELEPGEIEGMISKDRASWIRYANAFHDSSLALVKAVDARDIPALMTAGGKLDETCEACHKHYWYPNDVRPGPE